MSPPPRCRRRGRDRKRRPPRSSGARPRLSPLPSSRGPKGRGYHELQELPAGVGGSERPFGDVHSWDGYVASVLPNRPIFVRSLPVARVLLDYGQEVPLLLGAAYVSSASAIFLRAFASSPRSPSPRTRSLVCAPPATTSGLLPLHSHPFKRGWGGSGSSSKVGVGAREKWEQRFCCKSAFSLLWGDESLPLRFTPANSHSIFRVGVGATFFLQNATPTRSNGRGYSHFCVS